MTPKRQLTITGAIIAGFACALVLAATGTWYSLSGLHRMRDISRNLYEHPFAVSNAAAELKGALFELRNDMIQVVMIRNPGDDKEALFKEMNGCEKTMSESLAVIKRYFLGDMKRVDVLETELREWSQIRKSILERVAVGDIAGAERLVRSVGTPKFNQMTPEVDYVLGFARNKGRYFADEADREAAEIQKHVAVIAFALGCLLTASSVLVVWRVRFLHRGLAQLATTDFLTGLPNRRRFMEQAEGEFVRAARYQVAFALAVADIDFFKRVNDQYGHGAGDAALKTFAAICKETLRESDFVGRIGGEEFGVLLTNTSLDEAKAVLERLRLRIAEAVVTTSCGEQVRITASFGLASSDAMEDLDALFNQADKALYDAKESGRNRICSRP